jgi:hypothetical protein
VCPDNLDVLDYGLWRTGFGLRNRRGSILRSSLLDSKRIVLNAVKVQLRYEPLRETRNRKPLRPNPLAPWELRVGSLRVFYEVDALEPDLVNVLAIGVKRGIGLSLQARRYTYESHEATERATVIPGGC